MLIKMGWLKAAACKAGELKVVGKAEEQMAMVERNH